MVSRFPINLQKWMVTGLTDVSNSLYASLGEELVSGRKYRPPAKGFCRLSMELQALLFEEILIPNWYSVALNITDGLCSEIPLWASMADKENSHPGFDGLHNLLKAETRGRENEVVAFYPVQADAYQHLAEQCHNVLLQRVIL